ncbi:IMP dehydrogenase [Azorhizobium caulinodans ORS 571]|uniref:IMP dehydrogenase n=1 Tax=Azorhizobium caulinodans (strain ATCC 43989 / DSM 5975 / JCM 20966 / LMG 6465 / NBRC 14845 / NCIMB 13405 / ORS 571) TaxID=438753 RepID=A8HYL0_AZOC5|nr:IMP dehydrogenase [Azorhizobium caulinodans ORS 571]
MRPRRWRTPFRSGRAVVFDKKRSRRGSGERLVTDRVLPPSRLPAMAQQPSGLTRRALLSGGLKLAGSVSAASLVAACAGGDVPLSPTPQGAPTGPVTGQPLPASGPIVALILPLGAQGNAALAGQALKNAAELAMAELGQAPIQLVVKDDGGTSQGARNAAEQAINEGARIILGPLFATSVGAAAQAARPRGIPIIAFSTDTNVAGNGVFLLSFLPQTDVDRIIRYTAGQGKRSFSALIPENAYGTVVQGAFQQTVGDVGGRVMALERYTPARLADAVKRVADVQSQTDAIFIPDSADSVAGVVQQLSSAGVDLKRIRLLGTGLWDEPRLFSLPQMEGAQFAAPDAAGWRNFSQRYRARYGSDPVRTATLAYDAVSLVSAIVRTQGPDGLNTTTLTNPSGFAGVDGAFRFRADGSNERALAVMEIRGGQVSIVSPPPRTFGSAF